MIYNTEQDDHSDKAILSRQLLLYDLKFMAFLDGINCPQHSDIMIDSSFP